MAKKDGEKIAIVFSQPLLGIGSVTDAFSVSFQQYDMVPGGSLIDVTRPIVSMELDSGNNNILYLNMGQGVTRNFRNAVGNITVSYDASIGRLYGEGGPVQSFTQAFAPTDLEPKDNPHEMEHLTIEVEAEGTNIKIYYHDTSTKEHLEISASAIGVRTYIGDL